MTNVFNRAILKGPLRTNVNTQRGNPWAGITTIASGTTSVTVSTTSVKSDSLFQLSIQSLTDQTSGDARHVEVRTIVDGGYFILGYADGQIQARSVKVHWILMNTK